MAFLYDYLVRIGLEPQQDFEFNLNTDSLMHIKKSGVRKLVDQRWKVTQFKLHISLIPNDNGVVETALASASDERKRPGFWHVILDSHGRPVAEHPLTWTQRSVKPSRPEPGKHSYQPPTANQAVDTTVETHGDLARLLVSWLIGYSRINDDETATILEILSSYAFSPREIILEFKDRRIVQRLHDELLCFEDDVNGIPGARDQAASLREELTRLLTEDRL